LNFISPLDDVADDRNEDFSSSFNVMNPNIHSIGIESENVKG
jgi:hypothetical protein